MQKKSHCNYGTATSCDPLGNVFQVASWLLYMVLRTAMNWSSGSYKLMPVERAKPPDLVGSRWVGVEEC